jgi:hypothetical protein
VEEVYDKIPELAQYTLPYHKVMKEVFKDTETYWAREQIEKMAFLGGMSELQA